MSPAKLFFLRFLILLVAIAIPAGGFAFWAGKPAKLDLPTLEAWAPVKEAGPSAPLLLGVLLVFFVFLIYMPWLIRRLIDAVKVLIGIAIAAAAIAGAIGLCLSLSAQHALVFTLIEYFVGVVTLTVIGNLWLLFRRGKAPRRVIPADPAPLPAGPRRDSRVVQPLMPRGRQGELPPPGLAEHTAEPLREREAAT